MLIENVLNANHVLWHAGRKLQETDSGNQIYS